MKFEGVPKNDSEEGVLERPPKAQGYHEAVTRYNDLMNVVPEAEKILFRGEKPPRDEQERIIAEIDLKIDALRGEVEAFAQKENPYAERAMQMLAQFKEAEKTILCLYFDALNVSPEFAAVLRKEHPWLGEAGGESEPDLPEVEYVE